MWKTLKSKIALETNWLKIIEETFKTQDDKIIHYTYLQNAGSVHIVPITKNKELILIESYRPTLKKFCYEIPAGSLADIEENISPEQQAKQELKEEIGGITERLEKLGEFYILNGLANTLARYYVAHDVELSEEQSLEDSEYVKKIHTINKQTLEEMISDNVIDDGDSMIGILLALKYIE